MEYLVMECGLSYAVVMDGTGRFWKVPNLGYTVGQMLEDVVLLPERLAKPAFHKRLARWGTMAACVCLLLLGSWVWQSPIGTVRMQINPDVQLCVNRFDRVVALEGLNEDGAALIDGYHAYGKGMKTVSDELADRAVELGYLSDGGQITLTVDSKRDGWKTAAEEMLLLELEIHFERRITVTVGGKESPIGQEPSEEIIIIPSRPDEDTDEDDPDDDLDDDTLESPEIGSHEDDDDDDDDDDDIGEDNDEGDYPEGAVSTSGNADDRDEQEDTPPVSESDDPDDDDTHGGDDDEDPEQPDDSADDNDSDDDNENEDD